MFGANVSKILLDPDHLGLKDDKSTKIRWPRIFSPLAQIWPLLKEMLAYCENFESAKQDRDKLRNETQAVSGISSIETS